MRNPGSGRERRFLDGGSRPHFRQVRPVWHGPVFYGNGTGDTFTFEVYRCATGTVSFRSEHPEPLCQPLVQNLTNGPHTLEIVTTGDGDVSIEAFYVFQPPVRA